MPQVNSRFVTRRPWEEINDVDKQEVIRALALGYSVRQASKIVHRNPAQVFEWARTDPGFAAALNAIAADKDDEVVEFRERVRRAAATMLDNLLDLADAKQPSRERNAAIKTFFADLHQPVLLPRTPSGPQAPTVLVHAQQAAFLVQGAAPADPADGTTLPPPSNGAAHVRPPSQLESASETPSVAAILASSRGTTTSPSGLHLSSPDEDDGATTPRSVGGNGRGDGADAAEGASQ